MQNYLETFIATRSLGGGAAPGAAAGAPGGGAPLIAVRPVVFYNRTLDSTNFIVPGLVAIVMMMLGALLTSVTIAREKEMGTMEQILVSPIRPFEVIAGKVLPYLVLAFSIAMIDRDGGALLVQSAFRRARSAPSCSTACSISSRRSRSGFSYRRSSRRSRSR